jgi:hypothetical protein
MMIHEALHSSSTTGIHIAHELHEIQTGKNGCKYVTWKPHGTFMIQNPNKKTKFSKLALAGSTVTWVMRQGGKKWGLIVNNQIQRE